MDSTRRTTQAAPPDLATELRKVWRLATAPLRALPHFIIAGAPKCGTSSLYDLLTSHPDLRRAARKEPTNFVHYPRSALRSRMHMPLLAAGGLSGEASVEYFTHPDAPASIHAVVPDVRFIFMLREPVARAWSDHQMYLKAGQSPGDFGTLVRQSIRWLSDPDLTPLIEAAEVRAMNPVRFVSTGMYVRHLKRWLAQFQRAQMIFITTDELREAPSETCNRLFDFLGVSPHEIPDLPSAREGAYSATPPDDVAEELSAFYDSVNAGLSEMTGTSIPWH